MTSPLLRPLVPFLALVAAPALAQAGELGFEELPVGEFEVLESALGRWTARAGAVEIDPEHARSASQCLHLGGGEGQAASRVELALERGDRTLRFTSEAPAGTGVLIDALSLAPAKPMELVSVTASQPRVPVLVGNRVNPVLRLRIETEGNLEPLVLGDIRFDLEGTTRVSDFSKLQVLVGADGAVPGHASDLPLYGELPSGLLPSAGEIALGRDLALRPGVNDLWLSLVPEPGANIDGFVDARPRSIRFAGWERSIEVEESEEDARYRQRMGVALRNAGDDGAEVYRIPGLVTTPKGTLIGVYDVRWKGWGDLPGDIDVGLSRSTDGGRSWEAMRVVMDMGDDPKWRHDGVGDPAVLVDRETGRVYVVATWSHGDRSWRGSGPGLEPEETGQLMLVHSDDDGRTWSKPRNLTRELKDPSWCFLLQGPGRGITMGDGTLVFPAQFQLSPEEQRIPHSTVIYSRDHGQTWEIGSGVLANTTESAVVELEDGVLMSNQRNNRGGSRSIHTSTDLGKTWSEHASSRSALREPVCMASLIHVGRELTGEADGLLLFSNPDVLQAPRRCMSIKASRDSGATWPSSQALLLDEEPSAGYSCLTMIDAETVGILYEGSRAHMTFQRVPLADVLAGGEARE